MNDISLAQSYALCDRVARRHAANFYPAFRLLARPKRRAMCALYAFMRVADDIADGPGTAEQKGHKLAAWRDDLRAALDGHARHFLLPALRDTVQRFAIPARYLEAVVDGVAMDLGPLCFRHFGELYRYCFHVASAVGLACIHVWGFHGETAERLAEYAGIAFQLTNILRDLPEDYARGRVYLPSEDLEVFGCPPECLSGPPRSGAFQDLMRFQVDRARQYYRAAEGLPPLLTADGRAVFQLMAGTYRGLLDEIERRDYDVFTRRVALSRWTRLRLAAQALPGRWGWGRGP
jgi:phytoene synthase